jgi:UDP-glucose 4-epimerase
VRVIVTGGAGFIGSHLVDALVERGDEVHVLDNLSTGKESNVADGAVLHRRDLREPIGDLFDEVRPETCFHLGAQANVRVSVAQPIFDAEVNLLGTVRLLEAAARHGTQLVFSSTGGAIYGECEAPAPESAELQPLSPYGASKLGSEEYLAAFRRLGGAPHVSLRYANVYGPRQDPHGEAGVVAIFFEQLAAGEVPTIFGDGEQTRDYVHVDDVVAATLAAQRAPGAVYNVGTGIETTVNELFALCRDIAKSSVEAEYAPARPGELERSVLDATLARSELGWEPAWALDDGLRSTWKWERGKEASAQGRI